MLQHSKTIACFIKYDLDDDGDDDDKIIINTMTEEIVQSVRGLPQA